MNTFQQQQLREIEQRIINAATLDDLFFCMRDLMNLVLYTPILNDIQRVFILKECMNKIRMP